MGAKFQEKHEKDLFEQLHGTEKKVSRKTGFLMPRIKDSIVIRYENIVFLFIGFLISCVICFSLGVEKGRQDATRTSSFTEGVAVADTERQWPEDSTPAAVETVAAEPKGFVVQLATVKSKDSAEKEVNRLIDDGYGARARKSGEYYQIYVGVFSKKAEADRMKEGLIRRYNDCYVTNYKGD
jgi:hypothetical protein